MCHICIAKEAQGQTDTPFELCSEEDILHRAQRAAINVRSLTLPWNIDSVPVVLCEKNIKLAS